MRRKAKLSAIKQTYFLLFAVIIITAGCALQKQSGFNRTMQNLTAHYNILFNAKEILRQKQEAYATSYVDNYNEILSVYQDTIAQTTTPDKDLESAVARANTIINVKEQSHYIGDAYLVLGKAYYLEGNFFNAVEYFSYVIRSFPLRKDLVQEALVWKGRTLLYLNQLPQAKLVLDTAIQNSSAKKRPPADIFAAKLQYDIDAQDYADGEDMAKKAISLCRDKIQRLRWTFILGQLQEVTQKPADAFISYSKIAKSNASFEMAFNASLNCIRIEDTRNGIKLSRTDRLLSLLKDPNNKEFIDQVYYQVAEIKRADKDFDNAIKYYKLSVRNSLKNQNQKGLSYLRLAEIYFKNKADYDKAKKYYDSTLTTLPVNYPGYVVIQKTGSNLQLLADRMQIISKEDTLQALARMDEKTRLALIDKMVTDNTLQQQVVASANSGSAVGSADTGPQTNSSGGSTFYFYNTTAISQGYTDFKRKWGNRKLEDNWRRSNRSGSDITNNTSPNAQSADPDAPPGQLVNGKASATAGAYRQELIKGVPLTADQLAQSNLRVYNAYVDVGNFYRDILGDKNEAINTYELILRRFPNDPNKPAIYYNLYRLYSEIDPAKSLLFKNKLLKDYPETPFAKIISDPDFAKKLNDVNAEFTQAYNQVFDLYARKKYKEVIAAVPVLVNQYPANKYLAQLYYLQAIAEGHYEKVTPFKDTLQQILKRFPDDKLISPLINQHLAYINTYQAELQTRNVVLSGDNPDEVPFTLAQAYKKETEYRRPFNGNYVSNANLPVQDKKTDVAAAKSATTPLLNQPVANPPVQPVTTPPLNQPVANNTVPPVNTSAAVVATPVQSTQTDPDQAISNSGVAPANALQLNQPVVNKALVSTMFNMRDSTNYYFVVNVSSGTTNLSSSRFGIGQFNRANYAGNGIRHQLIPVEASNQLIYVGRFMTLEGVKKYARQIIPLLPEIMKVPKDKYSFFIITQENLNKLADKKTLDTYFEYYQQNY